MGQFVVMIIHFGMFHSILLELLAREDRYACGQWGDSVTPGVEQTHNLRAVQDMDI